MASFDLNSSNQYIHLWCEWFEQSVDPSTNTSVVHVEIYGQRTNSGYTTYGTANTSVNVDGETHSEDGLDFTITSASATLLFASNYTVTHNADGSKSVNISVDIDTNVFTGNGNQTVTLTKIPRYANFTKHKISSTGLTSISVEWSADSNCDFVQYSLNGGAWKNTSGSTYTISGLSPNTTYTIKTKIRRTDSQLWTESSSISGTTKDIGKISSASNFEHGSNASVSITNPSR